MNIVVLSGKGGTGKTLVSTNLAVYLKANYIDADVEEPNGFIFLKPENIKATNVKVDIPFIDEKKCKHCFKCVGFCEFNVFAKTKNKILVFDKLCHSCGGCKLVCPNNAISYKSKVIGTIEEGVFPSIKCKRGILKVGELMGVPIVKELLKELSGGLNVIDSSPGTSCNVVNILNYADVAILVTEPTKFGLHDLNRAVELVRNFNIPLGVVINKVIYKDNIIRKYCSKNNISILGEIIYDKNIAVLYSKGELLVENSRYKNIFKKLSDNIKEKLLCKLQ